MRLVTKDELATFLITLAIALIPGAAIAEIGGVKNLARYILWGSSASLLGTIAMVPEIKKDRTSVTYLEGQIKEYLADCLSLEYPNHNTRKLVEIGAKFSREMVRWSSNSKRSRHCPIDPRHTYLVLFYLVESQALQVYANERNELNWKLRWNELPRLYFSPPTERGKCFSCQYWTDPYGVNEVMGKRPNDLTCAIRPLHTDTKNGCDDYQNDALKIDLRLCLTTQA